MHSFPAFLAVAAAVTLTPGPAFALLVQTAVVSGRQAALATLAGNAVAVLAWGALSAVGVSALVAASRLAYDLLRAAGAAYLLWLGARRGGGARRPVPDGAAPRGCCARSSAAPVWCCSASASGWPRRPGPRDPGLRSGGRRGRAWLGSRAVTFSIVGRTPDGTACGVAVASKFLAAGAYVPAASPDAGALATQARVNLELRSRGLELLRGGRRAGELLETFFRDDPDREERQAGVVDRFGGAATFTGALAQPWAGGRTGEGLEGSYAAQGNLLAGPEVVDAMVASWLSSAAETDLARRLVQALAAGQEAGGDPRGKQAAALLVVSPGAGYGGFGDVAVDLRCDDSAEPIAELHRMLDLHDLYFGSTPEEELLDYDDALLDELRERLASTGYATGDVRRDLYGWMGRENFEERWRQDRLDPVVLAQLRARSGPR